ncbi:hypothetical protein [Amycolatopsis sp. NPDC059657]|uniref:hypothetical protein n=1 Tax=Amycolatopsis sp. NPDC059657 TaxID=3346899 RepID=UPI003672507A
MTMRIRKALTLAMISIATLGLVTPLAQADSTPTTCELLDKCNNGTDSCVFHPASRREFGGRRQHVGRTTYNCSSVNQIQGISWADTDGGSNSLGISIDASMKFAEVYTVSVSATYSHSWEWSHTVTRTDNLNTPAWGVGEIFHAPLMQTVTGNYELHFRKPFYGHYYWYVNNFSATSPLPNDGSVTFHTRAMTKDERNRCPR